jgi:glycosyltransferase involved in cell wall biosynthesis
MDILSSLLNAFIINTMNSRKLFIIVNVDWFFLSHRLPVALAAKKAGWNVTIVTADTGKLNDIKATGLDVINLPMSRSGMNLAQELHTLSFLYKLYQRERPDVVHHVGMKTILWGTLAAKFSGINGIVNAISGLGGFFAEDNKGLLSKVMPKVLKFSHRLKRPKAKLLCIFQNDDDWNLYVKHGIIKYNQGRFIKGSGVDLSDFVYTTEPNDGKIIVILTARMIVEKGVFLLTDAAERLRVKYEDKVEFWLVGGLDDHPGAITESQLNKVCDERYIKWLGYRTDIRDLLRKSHIVAFPSYYMEGLPKSLIEANATGRPIITTNSVGCKETVIDGYNGYLIEPKNVDELTNKLERLLEDKELRLIMGQNSRKYAEKYFDINTVIDCHLAIYHELLTKENE